MSLSQDITVSAAASLTNVFEKIANDYQTLHPNVHIHLNFGGSGTLLQQMDHGAPVDIFASADQETMNKAEEKHLIDKSSRQNFASNSLVLIASDPHAFSVVTLDDLLHKDIQYIAIGHPDSVPAGNYAKLALTEKNLWETLSHKMIITQNVRQSLSYVIQNQVDVGFVYKTDALLEQADIEILMEIPLSTPLHYPIAKTQRGAHNPHAQKFIDYILSLEGQKTLQYYGFSKP